MSNDFKLALRTFVSLLAVACISCGESNAQEQDVVNTPVKDKWAVVVGISSFANSQMNLKYAAKDAQDFKNFLIDKCHFAKDHIKLLTNEQATKDRILDVLGDSWLPRVTLPDDLVVIFISSHGSPSTMDVCGVNYVVAHDTNPDKLFTTGIPIQHLANTIKERVHANRVLIILDACHSGGASDAKGILRAGNVDASQIAQGTGHVVICSSAKTEVSWESKKYSNSVFTHSLMEALITKGENTKLGDAFNALKDSVQQQVVAERGVIQTPVLEASKWKGHDLVLAAVPTRPRQALAEQDEPSASKEQIATSPNGSGMSATTQIAQGASKAVPDLSGDFLGTNGLRYHYWQKGRVCGWEMPEFGEVSRGSISEDGTTLVSSWSGPITGSGTSKLETDSNGRVVCIRADDGTVLNRIDDAIKSIVRQIPNLAGAWRGNNGIKYKVWQNGNSFGWKLPRYNEVGVGTISDDGKTVNCSWSGPLANRCTGTIEFDATGKAVRIKSDIGMTMARLED